MRWDESVRGTLPNTGIAVIAEMRQRWSGTRIYITDRAARLDFDVPVGAAERFASDLDAAVRRAGATRADTRRILLPLMRSRNYIY